MQNYSKEFQDIFVSTLLPIPGFFLDIGMGDPVSGNNTLYLENLGWTGFMFDRTGKDVDNANSTRRNRAICCDAANFNWRKFLRENNAPKVIDYISLDVDEINIDVINNFPLDEFEFKIMTFEHDRYNSGDDRKNAMIRALSHYPQYLTLLENAKITGLEWEDWVINTKYFDMEKLRKFIQKSIEAEDYIKNLLENYKNE